MAKRISIKGLVFGMASIPLTIGLFLGMASGTFLNKLAWFASVSLIAGRVREMTKRSFRSDVGLVRGMGKGIPTYSLVRGMAKRGPNVSLITGLVRGTATRIFP